MPALPTDLTTVADFKLVYNVAGSSDDQLIQRLITATSGWMEQECNRKFVARRYNGAAAAAPNNVHPTTTVFDEDYHYFDGDPSQVDRHGGLYYLPQYPVQPNSVLTFNLAILTSREAVSGNGDTYSTTQLVEGRDYIVDRALGCIRLLGAPFEFGVRNYRVTYAAGFMLPGNSPAAPYVPTDLSQLCNNMMNNIYSDKANLASESTFTWSRSYDLSKEDPYVAGVLGNYKRFSIYL